MSNRKGWARRVEEATDEEIEEMHRRVKDIVAYIMNFDVPEFADLPFKPDDADAIMMVIQLVDDMGTGTYTHTFALGKFQVNALANALRSFLIKATLEVLESMGN